jgi:adenylosuccinate lyase
MVSSELVATSPVDGRYRNKCASLANYFSEAALIKYRIHVEIEYFIQLSFLGLSLFPKLTTDHISKLRSIVLNFTENDLLQIKEIENTTRHDVKAVEYFLKKKLTEIDLDSFSEFIHFGLTSQDINNCAVPLSVKEAMNAVMMPGLQNLVLKLKDLGEVWGNIPMLARTHGQPASPTRVGKEIMVFHERILKQIELLKHIPYSAKFGGATGNFNAHFVAYPEINWHSFAEKFVESELGLSRSYPTTQIEHYDNIAALFDNVARINVILIDLCRDMWTYISYDYFKQKLRTGEIGSSAMPHKVNPIDFENAEGNLGIANALFGHLSSKLPVSRLQRDLTDSTVMRNIGVPFAHTLISYQAIIAGLDKLIINLPAIENDLESNWATVAEGIQTVLRSEGYPNPYEALLELTRTHDKITKISIDNFITDLQVSESVKTRLRAITPQSYTGK